ncbi:hypothetical protein P3X46_023617 [Hevea brasiliensis]|uniref:PGG domain-containing protein n=1 Tax=Hevea brasiliensis TaxID=3981 RepID=A0ABQ9LCN5_HEVBR|nr:hypothetical protein P3X46_023617 [Hevea brasiliensis]
MAAPNGHVEIFMELMKIDSRLCRLEGKKKKTPPHCAAIKGRADTALHQAVKRNQFQAVNVLLNCIREKRRGDLLSLKDELGNIAAWKGQRQIFMNLQVIELFLGSGTNNSGILEVNAKNNIGPTAQALDMVLVFPVRQVTQKSQRSFRVLELCQQKRSASLPFPHFNVSIRTQHSQGIDSPCEARSALLVIAVLVATATFQVGVSPPGCVWQDSYTPDQSNSTRAIIRKAHYAGESILATSGLSLSLFMIHRITNRFPLQFELQMCIVAMYFTYNTALINMSLHKMKLYVVW